MAVSLKAEATDAVGSLGLHIGPNVENNAPKYFSCALRFDQRISQKYKKQYPTMVREESETWRDSLNIFLF